jgi:hypothetical protein
MEMVQEIEDFNGSCGKVARAFEDQDIELKTLKVDYSNLYNRSNLLELENKKILEEKRSLLSEYKILNDKNLMLAEKLRMSDLISSYICMVIDLHTCQLDDVKKMICRSSYD